MPGISVSSPSGRPGSDWVQWETKREEPWPDCLLLKPQWPWGDGLVEGPLGVCAQAFFSPGGTGASSCPQPGPSPVVFKYDSSTFGLFRGVLPSAQSPKGPSRLTYAALGEPKPALK